MARNNRVLPTPDGPERQRHLPEGTLRLIGLKNLFDSLTTRKPLMELPHHPEALISPAPIEYVAASGPIFESVDLQTRPQSNPLPLVDLGAA
jgi:hypothetical protein